MPRIQLVVSLRPVNRDARIQSKAIQRGIFGGQSDTGTIFSSKYFGFRLSVSFRQCTIIHVIHSSITDTVENFFIKRVIEKHVCKVLTPSDKNANLLRSAAVVRTSVLGVHQRLQNLVYDDGC